VCGVGGGGRIGPFAKARKLAGHGDTREHIEKPASARVLVRHVTIPSKGGRPGRRLL